MGGGGGKTPEPTKFVSPPIDETPAKNPIPNFFANRPVGPSPYQAMGAFTPSPTMGAFGGQVTPAQFAMPAAPPVQQPTPQTLIEALAPVIAPTTPTIPANETITQKWERLGKGKR